MPPKPWSARGSPLLRRSSPPNASAGPTELVRQCLLRPPQPERLYVARPDRSDSRQLRQARVTHRLEPWEDLIAVWQWSKVSGLLSATPSSLIWTSCGIRIAEPRLRLAIAYGKLSEYSFRYQYIPGGRGGPDVCQLVIDGPEGWTSPNADQSAELIADDLNQIKALAAPPGAG